MAPSAQLHRLVCVYIKLKIGKKLCSKTINVPNARASTSMRARKDPSQSQHLKQDTIRSHRECLVQVHMTDITPTCRRVSQTDLRIQVRTCISKSLGTVYIDHQVIHTVKIHLSPIFVNDLAGILNAILKHTKRRRVCDLPHKISQGQLTKKKREVRLTMNAANLSLCNSAFAFKSTKSRLPFASTLTGMTFNPAITADAGFVPCALTGMR